MARGLLPDGTVAEVPGDMFGVVEEILYRWPNLRVQFLNPEVAGVGDAPYRIIERTPDGRELPVMNVWELDQRVIERLHLANGACVDIEKLVDEHNAKVQREEKRVAEDQLGESADKLATALEHFGKGKIEFKYTNDAGQKRVVREDGRRKDVTTKVL